MNNLSQDCTFEMGRIVLGGVKEIIGWTGIDSVLETAGRTDLILDNGARKFKSDVSYADLSAIQVAIESIYGLSGGRGIAQQAGRASFKFLARDYNEDLGFGALEYRLLPTGSRIQAGLEVLARVVTSLSGENITTDSDDAAWYWHIDSSPWCWQRSSTDPLCHFSVGVLQEYLAWTSGGKNYPVLETQCASSGAPHCTIRIDRTPLD
jgi:predicted hydrocarbon binding protein